MRWWMCGEGSQRVWHLESTIGFSGFPVPALQHRCRAPRCLTGPILFSAASKNSKVALCKLGRPTRSATPSRIEAFMSKRAYRADQRIPERHAIALGLQQKQSIRSHRQGSGTQPQHHQPGDSSQCEGQWLRQPVCPSAQLQAAHSQPPQPKLHRQGLCTASCATICTCTGRLSKLPGTSRTPPHDRRQQCHTEHLHLHLCPAQGELKKELVVLSAHGPRQALAPLKGKDRRGKSRTC